MTVETKRPRDARGPGYEKLAISLPRELAEAVRAEAKRVGAPSLSAFIAQVLRERVERDTLQEVLDEMLREQPMTDGEREWADRILDKLHQG